MPEGKAAAAIGSWRFTFAPGSEAALRGWNLDSATDATLASARRLGANEGREVRVLADPTGEKSTLYLKWFAPSRARAAARESARLAAFAERRQPAAPLLASARDEGGARLLVLDQLEGEALDERLVRAGDRERARLAESVGAALAALHRAGLVHEQLFAWHVLIGREGCVRWLDVADASVGERPPALAARARDLAALFATVTRSTWPLAARARLLLAYEPDRARRRVLTAAIRRERVHLLARGRLPRDWPHRERRSATQRLLVGEPWAALLEERGGGEVARWLRPPEAIVVRERDGRTNLRWPHLAGAASSTWFGKRFDSAPWRGRAWAFREFLAQRALAAASIPVAPIVAVGREEGRASVLWTAGVVPGRSVRERLPELPCGSARDGERARLLAEAARIARRLHAAGFAHRDLYLDHFLIERTPTIGRDAAQRLVLIDATRVSLHARLPARLRTKDLAALEYSARDAGASRVERWRALLVYARDDRELARTLARAAVRKADRIERREQRHARLAPRDGAGTECASRS